MMMMTIEQKPRCKTCGHTADTHYEVGRVGRCSGCRDAPDRDCPLHGEGVVPAAPLDGED